MSALMVEGVRQAIENYGLPITGEKMKNGWEQIKDFTLGGLLPPITVKPNDHEGGGWVQVYQTKDEKLVAKSDWIRGYREIVLDEVKKAVEKYKAGQQ
jgi:branched-chain amino acid transport system substrate-binding protein